MNLAHIWVFQLLMSIMLIVVKPIQVRSLAPITRNILLDLQSDLIPSEVFCLHPHPYPSLPIICEVLFRPFGLAFGNEWFLSLFDSYLPHSSLDWPLVAGVYGFCPFGEPELKMYDF